MKDISRYIISCFQTAIAYLERRWLSTITSQDEILNNLAPRIITEKSELEKISSYLTNLKKAINTTDINNIALTGSYGSGKSTILKTFQFHNPQYKYLNISLASFKDNKNEPDEQEFERKLEISILQQIFYHVKPSAIPDSRFKRIVNLTTKKLILLSAFLLLWVLSVIILFKFDYINKLNPVGWKPKYQFDLLAIALILIFLTGLGVFVKSVVRLFSNSKISKVNIQGEVELGESIDKSVFNQHLEEILYFFERTDFNVVIIEDVDRFNSTDIFTKLREINILINNSNLINRKVSFVYAIKDEMFSDKNERVKFFEFIIPVIPFINPSNAGEQLTKLINAADLHGVLSSEFTSDVITFIDDIDMRLLINIFHEYQLYSTNLSKDLEQDNLFAMIVYKNLFPDDFGELPKRRGNLYKFLSNRVSYASDLMQDIKEEINSIEEQVKLIESELDKPIKELRAVYVNQIISKLINFHSFYVGRSVTYDEILEDSYFNKIKESENIYYTRFVKHPYDSYFSLSENNASNLKFSAIEKAVSPSLSYNQRERNLISKSNNQVNRLKGDRDHLQNKISEIESLSIKEIFEQVDIDKYLKGFNENLLIRNLLLNGYINENYNDYISIFHGVNLTSDDFAFERKVKSGLATPFEYQLTKTENLIKRLPDKYFKRDVILNYILLDCLLINKEKFPIKIDNLIQLLSSGNEKHYQFVFSYIDRGPDRIGTFINKLVKSNTALWNYLKHKSGITEERLKKIISLVFNYSDITSISKFTDLKSLITYLEEMPDIVEYCSTFDNTATIKQFIKNQSLSFHHLDLPEEPSNPVFKYVYDGNYYQINIHNIEAIVKVYAKELQLADLNRGHYSSLKKIDLPPLKKYIESNLDDYIENVLLKLPDNNEEETTIIELLNSPDVNIDLKQKLVELQISQISILSYIEEVEVKEILLVNNKMKPSWDNVFDYIDSFEDMGINESLIFYLEKEENYKPLSTTHLNIVKDKDDEYIKNISLKLIYCSGLGYNSYTNLIKSVPYRYNNLDFTKIKKNKVEWMISKKVVTLKTENFNGLKDSHPPLHIKLLEIYEGDFVKKFVEFFLDSDDWFLLFKSETFTVKGKLELLKNFDDSIIVENAKIAEIVCDLLSKNEYLPLRYEVLLALFKANSSVQKRLELLNLHFDNLDAEQIQKLIEQLGDEYAKIFMKQYKPVFVNNPQHVSLFKKLQAKDLIIRYEEIEKKNEIRIIAKY